MKTLLDTVKDDEDAMRYLETGVSLNGEQSMIGVIALLYAVLGGLGVWMLLSTGFVWLFGGMALIKPYWLVGWAVSTIVILIVGTLIGTNRIE
jgi:hypothetical protein